MGILTTIKTSGEQTNEACPDVIADQNALRNRLKEIVGGDFLLAQVLHDERFTYMAVNVLGALHNSPLPVNKTATNIFQSANAKHYNLTPSKAYDIFPRVHGDAVLLINCELA